MRSCRTRPLRAAFAVAVAAGCSSSSGDDGSSAAGSGDAAATAASSDTGSLAPQPVTLAVLGDTQQTLESEVLLGREVNDEERVAIIAELAAQGPDAVIHVGDLVGLGDSEAHWGELDGFLAPVFDLPGPVYPVLGNHEYCNTDLDCARRHEPHDANLDRVFERFPAMDGRAWYSQRIEDVGLVLLDTNFWEYGVVLGDGPPEVSASYQEQIDWFQETIDTLEEDATVTTIIVAGHHPMWSNADFLFLENPLAPVVESEDLAFLREAYLDTMLAAPKVRLYLSGHAHGFEHFREGGIDFVVSGGGGGPRPGYLPEEEAEFEDLYGHGVEPRPFNYLLVHHEEAALRVEIFGFDKGETEARLLYELDASPR